MSLLIIIIDVQIYDLISVLTIIKLGVMIIEHRNTFF